MPDDVLTQEQVSLELVLTTSNQMPKDYHVYPMLKGVSHEISEDCSCGPFLLMDYGNGTRLWLHRRERDRNGKRLGAERLAG